MDTFYPFIKKEDRKKKDIEPQPLYVELYPPPPPQKKEEAEEEQRVIIIEIL